MGERALALIRERNRVYCFRSQWGAREDVIRGVFLTDSPSLLLSSIGWRFLGEYEVKHIPSLLDSHTLDAMYLITPRSVRVYCPLWFGLGLQSTGWELSSGVFVPVFSFDTFRRLRLALRQFKGRILDWVGEKVLTHSEGVELLGLACRLLESTPATISPSGEDL